ncbi:MAG: NADH-quinone oxidoreductase subunit A [Candidatus Bathyarchaeia archaeon]
MVTLVLSKILRPSNPNPTKKSTYECGQSPRGAAHDFMLTGILHYFIYALIFFVFDALLWILITYAVVTKTLSSFIGFLAYLSIIFIALVYFLQSLGKYGK